MNEKDQTNIREYAYKNRLIILGIVLTGIIMSVLDGYMVSIALPSITTSFNISITQSQWIISGYLLVMTGLFIFFGKLSEYIGKTKLFMVGWLIFTISSLVCGLTHEINLLIFFRIVQAVGASAVAGVSGAILFHTFPQNEIGKAMGYFGAAVALGSIIGPVLGGLITNSIGWQYIFLINVPIGVLLLIFAMKYLKIPESRVENFKIDGKGVILFLVTISSLILFLNEIAQQMSLQLLLIYGLIFIVGLTTFIFQERRSNNPMLELSLFKNKKFLFPVLSALFFTVAINMGIFIGPFYFQGVMGYNPLQTGIILMFVPIAMLFASPLAGKLYDKYHWKYAAGFGALISTASFVLLGYAYLMKNLTLILFSLLLWGVGYGLFTSPNTSEALVALPLEKTAIASSVATTARSLGGSIGVSFATVLYVLIGLKSINYQSIHSVNSVTISIATIMMFAGIFGLLAVITSILRNRGSKTAFKPAEHSMQSVNKKC
jgi:EmrB/QacA subfamily drug resistance transporter